MIIPMLFIGLLAGPGYVVYVVWPGPVISTTLLALYWQKVKAQSRNHTNQDTVPLQLLPPPPANRLKRAPRDRKTMEERLIQLSIPRGSYAYGSISVDGYNAEHKLKSTTNVKKTITSIYQKGENDKKSAAMVGVLENNQDIKWWNKEFSACVVK